MVYLLLKAFDIQGLFLLFTYFYICLSGYTCMTESEYKDALSWILARYDLELSGQEESKMREMLVKVNVYENNIIIPEPTSEGIADFLKDQNANCQL